MKATLLLALGLLVCAHGIRLSKFKRSSAEQSQTTEHKIHMTVKEDLKADNLVASEDAMMQKQFESLLERGTKSASIVTYEDEPEAPSKPTVKVEAGLLTGKALRSVDVPTDNMPDLTKHHNTLYEKEFLTEVEHYVPEGALALFETAAKVHPNFKPTHSKYQEKFKEIFSEGPTWPMSSEMLKPFGAVSEPTPLFPEFNKEEDDTVLVPLPVSFLETMAQTHEKQYPSPYQFPAFNTFNPMPAAMPQANQQAYPSLLSTGMAQYQTFQQQPLGLYAGGLQAPPPPPRPDNLPPPPYIRPVPQPEGA